MQELIKKKDVLLNPNGKLRQAGYGIGSMFYYNKEAVKHRGRLREWDSYYISDNEIALLVAVANIGSVGALTATVVDLKAHKYYTKTSFVLKKDAAKLSLDISKGTSSLRTKKADFNFETRKDKRVLKGTFTNFYADNGLNRNLEFEIEIGNNGQPGFSRATSFKKENQFYLGQKLMAMPAAGKVTFKGKIYTFYEGTTLASLDWGRAALPYSTVRYLATIQLSRGRHTLAFNLSRGFGSDEAASENIIIYDNQVHKVERVRINIQRNNKVRDYMGTWTFYSSDGKVELMFVPDLDAYAPTNGLIVAHLPHRVFGKFSGKLILDDGKELEIENVTGYAERVVNLG